MREVKVTWIAIGFGVVFWFVDAGVDALVFGEGTVFSQIVAPSGYEVWVRTVVVCLSVAFGAFADLLLARRERAERNLRAERNFASAVLDAAGALVVVLDRYGRIVRFNQACERTTGYTFGEVKGRYVWDILVASDEVAGVGTVFSELSANAVPNRYENHWVSKDGQRRLISWSNTVLTDDTGAVEYVIASGTDVTERRQTEEALRQSQEMLSAAQAITNMGSWDLNIETNELTWSDETYRIFGLMPREIDPTYEAFLQAVHPADRDQVVAGVEAAVNGTKPYDIEHRIVRPSGEQRTVHERGAVSLSDDGRAVRMIGTVYDITDRKEAERGLVLADNVFNHSGEAIVIADAERRILRVNRAFTEITGYSAEEAVGRTPGDLLRSDLHDSSFYNELFDMLSTRDNWVGEIWDRRKDGGVFPSWQNISVVRDEQGMVTQYISIFTDITEKKVSEQRIQHLAHYDVLTDLPNRLLFNDRLHHAIDRSERQATRNAIVFLDLDRFKNVNDTLGHHVGDLLLQKVAHRLLDCVRKQDTVARLGGDEFIVLMEDLHGAEDAAAVARKMLDSLVHPVRLEGHDVVTTASIGISLYPEDGRDVDTLVKHADTAMYSAKVAGGRRYEFYTKELSRKASERFHLEARLRQSIEAEELRVYYQPQLTVDESIIVGVEALVRWQHPDVGLVPPAEFVPLAEETGFIERLGEWVLRSACVQAQTWQSQGLAPVKLAVNLSGQQILHGRVVDMVTAALHDSGFAPQYLELEITESFAVGSREPVVATLNALRALGVSLAIDDFGTGYSSLSALKRLPIDRIKIDRSFVADIRADKDGEAIATAILAMARSLGLSVTAEGVERPEQLVFLRQHGCEAYQGYHFSQPLPAADFERLLRRKAS